MTDTDLTKLSPPGPPPMAGTVGTDTLLQGDPKAKAMGEIGVSGVKIFSGYVNEEYLPELMGMNAHKIYRTMCDDSIVNAVINAITLVLRAVDWRVEPAEDGGAQAETEAEFARSLLDDMSHSWEDTISEILSMLIFGWSYHEIVLKRRVGPDQTDGSKRSNFTDGRIGIRKLPIRSQDSLFKWEMQPDGGVAGMWQQPPAGGSLLFIPIERGLLFRTTSKKNSPEGVSILRSAYRPWFIKRGIEDMEAIGIERELAGLPVVSIPKKYLAPGATAEEKAFRATADKIARDLKFNQQGGVVIPSETFNNPDGSWSSVPMMSVTLLSTGGRRAIETNPIIGRYNRDIARAALADFLTLGDEKGSYALSKNKSELFLRACETYLNQIAAVINRFLLPRIWAYNGIAHELMPTMKPGRITPVDLAELGGYLQALAGSGAPLFPNQELSNYLADIAGLPEPPEDIGLMAQPGTAPGPGHIDPNTGEPINPKIDPNTGMLQHEVDRQKAEDALNAASFMSDNRGPAAKHFGKHNPNHDARGRFSSGNGSLQSAMDRVRREHQPSTLKPSPKVRKWASGAGAREMLKHGIVAGSIGFSLHTVTDFAAAQAADSLAHYISHGGSALVEGLTVSGLSVAVQQAAERMGLDVERARHALLRGLDKVLGTKFTHKADDIANDDPEVLAFLQDLRDAIAGLTADDLAKRGSGPFPFDKWAENTPREDHGRWTFGSPTVSFVSPNVNNTDLDQAQHDLHSERQRELANASFAIDGGLGLHSDASAAIGAWQDGAESSLMFSSTGGSYDQVKLAAAMKGYLANQKAVLVFEPGAHGDSFMANFDAKGDVDSIHKGLLKDGLAFHTLVPTHDGAKVYVYGQGQDDLDRAGAAARGRNENLKVVTGHGEFIGTSKEDGTDAEQRADARGVYSKIIDAGLGAGHGGPHGATRWQSIQRHWSQTLKRLIAKYNERHDSLGRFDFSPYSTPASNLYLKYNSDQHKTAQEIIDENGGGARVNEIEARLAESVPTNAPVSQGGHVLPNGEYTPERVALHNRVLSGIFTDDAVASAVPAAGERPTLTVLGGRGGSGKSFLTGPDGPVDKSRALLLDSDHIKSQLPEYKGWNASMLHEEATHILGKADARAKALGLNVIHDATMKSESTAVTRIKNYTDAGYDVQGHYVFASPETAANRAIGRFLRGGETGRYVPVSVILGNTQNEANFDKLKSGFSKWSVYDNNGAAPKLVAKGGK